MKLILLLLMPISIFSQIQALGGTTQITDRNNGVTLTWSVGLNEDIIDGWGLMGNYRDTSVKGINYSSVDLLATKTFYLGQDQARFRIGSGSSWNDVDKEIDLSITLSNSIRLDEGFYVSARIDNIFRDKHILHFLIGFEIDIIPSNNKTKRFF